MPAKSLAVVTYEWRRSASCTRNETNEPQIPASVQTTVRLELDVIAEVHVHVPEPHGAQRLDGRHEMVHPQPRAGPTSGLEAPIGPVPQIVELGLGPIVVPARTVSRIAPDRVV